MKGSTGVSGGSLPQPELQRRLRDARLVGRCLDGEAAAWSELVDQYSRYVYAILTGAYRLDSYAAEDVFQEVFAKAYEHLGDLRDVGALRPWVAQMTRRLAIDHIRRRRDEQSLDPERIEAEAEDEIAKIDEALMISQALAELPPEFGEVIDRFFSRGESYRTIAAELDLAEGTVASRISRGLAKLREILDAPAGPGNGKKTGPARV